MRVVSGSARGVSLVSLDGFDTRPTTDRVKESMFNCIQFELFGKRVLDLFAGSGALGIEALSRGAAAATFVDQSAQAVAVVRKNLEQTRLSAQATTMQDAYDRFLQREQAPFDIVFLDPPYASDFALDAIRQIKARQLLSDGGIVVLEHDREQPEVDKELSAFAKKTYRYGKIFVTIYRNEGTSL